jgi:hypothetical protein
MSWHERASRRNDASIDKDLSIPERERGPRKIFSWRARGDMLEGEDVYTLKTAPDERGLKTIWSMFKPRSPEHLAARVKEYRDMYPDKAPFGTTRKSDLRQQKRP